MLKRKTIGQLIDFKSDIDPFSAEANDGRLTACIDFDGVLHSYENGWEGVGTATGAPVEGAAEFLVALSKVMDIAIYSSRSSHYEGLAMMKQYVKNMLEAAYPNTHPNGPEIVKMTWENIRFPESKPPAHVYIDDRAYRFEGTFPEPEQLKDLHPWYHRNEEDA